MRSMPRSKSACSPSESFSRVALYAGYCSLRNESPESCTQPRCSGRCVAMSRCRKLTIPHAADVFSPRPVMSGREMSAKNAR
jgi:hypothetical protein